MPNDYQKFLTIDNLSAKYFSIVEGDYASGVNSLKFSGFGKNEKLETQKVVALSPEGAVDIPKGEYLLSVKVWLDQGRAVKKLYLSLEKPKVVIPIDLTGLERRKWIAIEKKFSKETASSATDRFKIEVRKEDVAEKRASKFYLDDIAITPKKE